MVGTVMDPHPAYALGRGLKTLPLRMARHNANALGGRRVPRAATAASARSTTRGCRRIRITRSRGGR